MNMMDIEFASRRAWPALEEMETPGGVLRYAAGVSRRSNSMNPRCDRSFDASAVIQSSEEFFATRALPSVIRVVAPAGQLQASHYLLDAMLNQKAYLTESPTLVMAAPITTPQERCMLFSSDRAQWLDAWYRIKNLDKTSLPVHDAMLARIGDPCLFHLRLNSNRQPLATAMAVISCDYLGIFGVATAQHVRRQGLAQSMLLDLLAWGYQQGARYAYLQVETANIPARNLYEKNGFQELYSYWYRVKELLPAIKPNNHHDQQSKEKNRGYYSY